MVTAEMIKEHHEKCELSKKTMLEAGQARGPWDDEPNRIEWEYKGLQCLMSRNPFMLHWCGYVGVPKSHPFFGRSVDDVNLDAHGGVNYAGACSGQICHIPKPGEDDEVFWFGFDCAHAGDIWPFEPLRLLEDPPVNLFRENRGGFWQGRYGDVAYVKAEVEALADQLAEVVT